MGNFVIGYIGLFSAAALTLLVLPALYVMFEGRRPPPEEATA